MIRPRPLALHHPERRAGAQERRGQVGLDDLVPQLERHFVDRGAIGDAGVVDQHVDGAEALDRAIEQVLHRGFVGHVGRDRERFGAHALELRHQRLEPLGAARGEHDLGALAGEDERTGLADARAGAGDHHDATLQDTLGHLFLRPFRLTFRQPA